MQHRLAKLSTLFIPAFLLILHALLLFSSAVKKSPTVDEPLHLLSGYASLSKGDFGFSSEQFTPALGTMLNAVPLLFVEDLQTPPTPREGGLEMPWWTQFIFEQSLPGERLLLWCRIPTMVLSLLLGLCVFLFAKELVGPTGACLALALHTLSPNILAHGRLITTDLIASLLIFASCWALWRYLTRRRRAWLVAVSVLAGAGLAAKFSCLLLLPVIALALLWDEIRIRIAGTTGGAKPLRAILVAGARFAGVLLIAFLTLWSVYRFEVGPYCAGDRDHETLDRFFGEGPLYSAASFAFHRIPVPAPSYWLCLNKFRLKQNAGNLAYLHGEYSNKGWRHYYFVAVGLKTPLALFGLLALAALALPYRKKSGFRPGPLGLTVILPVLTLLLMAIFSTQNVGVRHVLPIYAFLHILAAWSLTWWCKSWGKITLVVATCWYLSCVPRVFPHFLPYFNELTGGPRGGHRWLLGSNLDWGQDLKLLANYVEEHRLGRISLAYFGNTRPEHYGIEYDALPVAFTVMEKRYQPEVPWPSSGYIAISMNELYDVFAKDKQRYAWLREFQPEAHVGHSIRIYHLSDP